MTDSTVKSRASWLTGVAATIFIFALAMDQVMMPIATTVIVEEFRTDTGMVQAAIALVSLVSAPLYITGGKLGDIHGKKRIFMLGLILWGIGPLIAAVAPSMVILIGGWSVIKALGMVLAIPASVGLLISNYQDENQRGQAFAYYGVGAVAAALVGPLLMGFAAESLSWRMPFVILVVLAVIALLMSARGIKETEKMISVRIDWGGTTLTFLAVASVVLGAMLGGRFGWWLARRPFSIGEIQVNPLGLSPAPWLIALGVVLAAILLARLQRMQDRGRQPLFSMDLFDNRTFFAAWGSALFAFLLSGSVPFIIPVFTQQALGFDSLQSALVMVAFSSGSIVLGFISGRLLQRMQARTLMQVFLFLTVIGLIWLVYVADVNMTLRSFLLPMFLTGAGFGVISAQLPNIQLAGLSAKLQGEGSGFSETGKELGIGLGTAVIGSIMFSMAIGGLVDNVAREIDLPLSAEQRAENILLIEDEAFPEEAIEAISEQVPNLEQLGNEAFVEAFQIALGVQISVMLVALLIASFIPRVEPELVTAEKTREMVADVSSKRL